MDYLYVSLIRPQKWLIITIKQLALNTEKILLTFIQNEFANDQIEGLEPDLDLLETGLVDSLGMMRLIRFIERKFERQIPFEDMTVENFSSVTNIKEYLAGN